MKSTHDKNKEIQYATCWTKDKYMTAIVYIIAKYVLAHLVGML